MDQKDNLLIQKIKQSDSEAFKKIFYKYHLVLFKYIYYNTKDYALSQDIVQETFLKIWLNRRSLKPELSFLSYIYKISNNLIKDYYKKKQVRDKHKGNIPSINESEGDNPETALNISLLEEKISSVVKKHLPQKCRQIFILSRIDGKYNQEIAALLNITKKTVENQLNLALKIIRKKLENCL